MELKRLRHLIALADERNFIRAAQRVHLSQSALSRSIQAAENEFGVRLFDRGTIEVSTTRAGDFVIERARKLLFDSRCLDRDMDLFRQKQIGELAFGSGPFPAATMLPRLIPELRQHHPEVRLRVEVNNWAYLTQHLRAEELDFFIADIRDLPAEKDLEIRRFTQQPGGFYLRAQHPLAGSKTITAAQIREYGIASVRLPQSIREQLARLLGIADPAQLPLALECDDVAILKRTVLGSDTVLAAIAAAVSDELQSGQLRAIHLRNAPALYSEVGIVSLAGRSHSPFATLVIQRLQDIAHALTVSE